MKPQCKDRDLLSQVTFFFRACYNYVEKSKLFKSKLFKDKRLYTASLCKGRVALEYST